MPVDNGECATGGGGETDQGENEDHGHDGDNDDIYMLFIYIVLNNYSICWLKYLFLVPSLSVSFSTTYILSFVLFLILYF